MLVEPEVMQRLVYRSTPSGYFIVDTGRLDDESRSCHEVSTHMVCGIGNGDVIIAVDGE